MNRFDHKMANVNEEAKKGRSKLAAQAADQDKKFREWANSKVKAIAAKTSAQFHKVRDTMAKDRHHADQALSHTSARMDAALNAAKALQDKRFAQTVSDIAEAKKEANDRVEKFRSSFKTDILHLSGVVEEQSNKLNSRMTQLAATVESNKAEQAHLNAQVGAELKRMVKVGNDRYAEHLKKDKELKSLMAKNKADTEKKMTDMSEQFYAQMADIKAQMKKDRAHAEHALSSSTDGLYKTLADNQQAQDAVNKELTAATRRAKLDAEAALKEAKEGFTAKVAALHETVKANEKKHNKKVMDLTGVVAANAIKDAQGRAELKKISDFNKNQMKKAVADAVHKGEQRALQIEKKMKDINSKTRAAMNNRITTEIGTLSKSIHSQIDELNLQTKEARAQMKAEILFAVKSAAAIAKDNLKKTVEWAEGEFAKLNQNLQNEAKLSAGERAAMAETVAKDKAHAQAQIVNAVEDGIESARVKADARFTGVYDTMLKDRKKYDEKVAGAVAELNDSIAKNSAIEDARFAKTVKDIDAARKEARSQVAQARKDMATAILTTTAKAKDLETRILGDLQVVSAMVVSDKAAQIKINNKVDAEMDRLIEKSNDYETTNKARRGVIRKMMEEYKQAAAQETAELAKESRADVKKLRSEQAATLLQFKSDLTEATEHVYDKLSKDNAAQEAALSNLKGSLGSAQAQTT